MKKLRNDLLQSAILGTALRRDKALRELLRLQSKLDELQKRAVRLAKRAAKERAENTARLRELEQQPPPLPLSPATQSSLLTQPQMIDDNDPLDIPDWLLRRRADSQPTDQQVAEQIKTEQAERKRDKARVRIEKMKAKQRGDTRKMPLSGKDALKFIKGDA